MNKHFLPSSTIEHFKCSECKQFLSVEPIRIKPDGSNICGRCDYEAPPDAPPLPRNYPYEAAAAAYVFPCVYKTFGCPAHVSFDAAKDHESLCCYRTHTCPVQPNCAWVGVIKDLPEHYITVHREFCIESTSLNLHFQAEIQPYLIYRAGSYFLLQTKFIKDQDKLLFSMVFLGNPDEAGFIRYTIQLGSNSAKSAIVLEERGVLPYTDIQMDVTKSIEVDFKGVQALLNHPTLVACSWTFKIDAELQRRKASFDVLSCPGCGYYMTAPIYECEHNHACCADCKGFEMDCTWCKEDDKVASLSRSRELEKLAEPVEFPCRWEGCHHKQKEIAQHEQQCLMRTYKCPFKTCLGWFGFFDDLVEHLRSFHPQCKVHTSADVLYDEYCVGSYDYILAHGELFWCHFDMVKKEGGLLKIYYKGRPRFASNFQYEFEVRTATGVNILYKLARFIKNRYEVRVPYFSINKANKYKIKITKLSESYVNLQLG